MKKVIDRMDKQQQRILIIDDDDRNIFALRAVLSSRGYSCSTAVSGLQALETLKQQKDISVALVDMMMPDMDGYELMALIKDIPSLEHVKLIAVTAQAMPGDKEKCLLAGAVAYISKPVDIDVLLNMLNEPLKRQHD